MAIASAAGRATALPSESRLRAAGPTDADAITAVVNRAYSEAEAHFTDALRTDLAEVTDLIGRGEFLIIEQAGVISGAVHISADGARGSFGMLAVAPACQGVGLGRWLVEAAEAELSRRGCTTVDIEVVDARVQLPPWYERMGYCLRGTAPYVRPPEECKIPVQFILMTKQLPTTAEAERKTPR